MADLQNAEELIQLIERIERVSKDIYAEVEARGYHTKWVRALVALRALDPEKRKGKDELFAMYREAVNLA